MTSKTEIRSRIAFCKSALTKLRNAYLALVDGGVKSYMIDDRQLTRLDLLRLSDEIRDKESELDQLESLLAGGGRRKAFAVLPRDW